MYYSSIFQQLFKFIPRYRFDKTVEKVSGDRYCKSFSAWRQFLTCLYAQITGKDSLREIAGGLATNLAHSDRYISREISGAALQIQRKRTNKKHSKER